MAIKKRHKMSVKFIFYKTFCRPKVIFFHVSIYNALDWFLKSFPSVFVDKKKNMFQRAQTFHSYECEGRSTLSQQEESFDRLAKKSLNEKSQLPDLVHDAQFIR